MGLSPQGPPPEPSLLPDGSTMVPWACVQGLAGQLEAQTSCLGGRAALEDRWRSSEPALPYDVPLCLAA